MTHIDIISGIVAILIGLLFGVQREYHSYKTKRSILAGARTFTLVSLFGFVAVKFLDGDPSRLSIFISLFIFVFLSIPVFKHRLSKPGMTTSVSLVLTLLIGITVGYGLLIESLLISLFIFIILTFKERMHKFASLLTKEELFSAVRFIAVAIVILPLAYSIGVIHPLIGPGRVFDTVKTVLMVIFVSSMSFTSFLVIKLIGPKRGMKIATFLGGFVNSAASTASISLKSKKNPSLLSISLISVLLANTSMIIKDLILILVLTGGELFYKLSLPVGTLIFISFIIILFVKEEDNPPDSFKLELGTPFAITPAVKFALIFSLISVSAFLLRTYFGPYGVYAVAIGGIVSTTSVSASLAVLYTGGEISSFTAVITLVLALGLGSLSKITIIRVYDKELMKKAYLPLLIIGILAFLVSSLVFFMAK